MSERTNSEKVALDLYYQDVLLSMFVFMLRDERSKERVETMVQRTLSTAQLIASKKIHKQQSSAGILGAILHEWYRNPRYLTNTAIPKCIRLTGKAPSVAALARKQGASTNGDQVAREMKKLGLVRRSAQGYLPVNRVATIRQLRPPLIDHVANSLERMLATVNYNTGEQARSDTLIERTAFVRDLPRKDLRAFRKFTQEQGSAFLANADEWLETRRAGLSTKRNQRLVRAGVHVYAFQDDPTHKD